MEAKRARYERSDAGVTVMCAHCMRPATACCTHAKCKKFKDMCPVHLAMHSEMRSTKDHSVVRIEGTGTDYASPDALLPATCAAHAL